MRLYGWCTECRKMRQVKVTRMALPGGTHDGICQQCEDEQAPAGQPSPTKQATHRCRHPHSSRGGVVSAEPILIPCEGAGCPTHPVTSTYQFAQGMCQMCGRVVNVDAERIAAEHDRPDIIAMLLRGDYDR